MEKVMVSIIVPCYGVEKYLDRCVDSLINQSLQNIEIILVDDGSKDNVPILCEAWKTKDCRIKVIHKQNEGLGRARNSGIDYAIGDYVGFVDADDFVDKEMFHVLYEEAIKSKSDVVYSYNKKENIDGTWSKPSKMIRQDFKNGEIKSFMLDMVAPSLSVKVERIYGMSVWRALYRRSIITNHKIRFLSEREIVSEDIPFQVDFLKNSKRVSYIPVAYYHYCLNGASLTASFNKEKYYRFRKLRSILISKLESDVEAKNRCDRFFIGYTRRHILHLAESNETQKLKHVIEIVNDPIWEKVLSRDVKKGNWGIHQKIVLMLIAKKKARLLLLWFYLVVFTKRFKDILMIKRK